MNSNSIAAGAIAVSGCDDSVDVDYTYSYVGGAYTVTDIVVSGINGNCNGADLGLTLDFDGTTVEYTGTVGSDTWAASSDASFASFAASADLTNVAVVPG